MDRGAPVTSPISMGSYPTLATALLALGAFQTASFFTYQMTTSRFNRSLARELGLGLAASVLLGLGTLFLLLWTGVFV